MNEEELQRPEARNIIDTIAEALRAGKERIDEELVLIPASYEIFLHPEAYEELKPIFPIVEERAGVRLDKELKRLNEGGVLTWARKLVEPDHAGTQYRRAGPSWAVSFFPAHDTSVPVDYIAVAAELVVPGDGVTVGKRTQRLTERADTGSGFKTRVLEREQMAAVPAGSQAETGAEGSSGRTTTRSAAASREEAVGTGEAALARITFTDDSGTRTVLLTATETAIGRRDDEYEWVEVQLDTLDDVSREHLRLRYNAAADRFEIKDLSSFGTTVAPADQPEDRRRVAPSFDEENEHDQDRWEPLPPRAVIGLADVIYLQFESLV